MLVVGIEVGLLQGWVPGVDVWPARRREVWVLRLLMLLLGLLLLLLLHGHEERPQLAGVFLMEG